LQENKDKGKTLRERRKMIEDLINTLQHQFY